jgi:transcriptional regulator with XRE-family HTH domain
MSPRQRKEVDTSTYTGRFAVRLKTLREKAGLSVAELAKKSGITERTLFRWETTSSTPINEDLPQLANALGVTMHSLLPKK